MNYAKKYAKEKLIESQKELASMSGADRTALEEKIISEATKEAVEEKLEEVKEELIQEVKEEVKKKGKK